MVATLRRLAEIDGSALVFDCERNFLYSLRIDICIRKAVEIYISEFHSTWGDIAVIILNRMGFKKLSATRCFKGEVE
jgi:hypothetical protein